MSSHTLQDNFDDSVGLYQDFIASWDPQTCWDSRVDVGGCDGGRGKSGRYGGRGGGKGRGRDEGSGRGGGQGRDRKCKQGGDVEDQHYSPAEYGDLNSEQKTKLRSLRIAWDTSTDTKSTAQLLAQIASLEAKVSQTIITNAEERTENEQNAGNSNQRHKALRKPKRGERGWPSISVFATERRTGMTSAELHMKDPTGHPADLAW